MRELQAGKVGHAAVAPVADEPEDERGHVVFGDGVAGLFVERALQALAKCGIGNVHRVVGPSHHRSGGGSQQEANQQPTTAEHRASSRLGLR